MDINKTAMNAARKICGIGQCIHAFDCGHPNKSPYMAPRIGTLQECPLAKYHVVPENPPKQWWERPAEDSEVTEDEIFALCANCEHGKRAKDKDGFEYIQRVDFESACLDCPVKAAEEARDEATAES